MNNIWSEIKTSGTLTPPEMAYHTAVIVGHYMIVFGGYDKHVKYEKCYENNLFFYNLECLMWQSVEHEHDEDLDFNDLGKKSMFTKMNNGPKKYATIDF